MQVSGVASQFIQTPSVSGGAASKATPPTGQAQKASSVSFSQTLRELNDMQMRSAQRGSELVSGEAESLHQVVLQTEESSLALNLAVSVRNKAVEAYQEVMRMQV